MAAAGIFADAGFDVCSTAEDGVALLSFPITATPAAREARRRARRRRDAPRPGRDDVGLGFPGRRRSHGAGTPAAWPAALVTPNADGGTPAPSAILSVAVHLSSSAR